MKPYFSRFVQFLTLSLQTVGCSLETELRASRSVQETPVGPWLETQEQLLLSGCKSVT